MNNIASKKPPYLSHISDKKWQKIKHKLQELVEIEFLLIQQNIDV